METLEIIKGIKNKNAAVNKPQEQEEKKVIGEITKKRRTGETVKVVAVTVQLQTQIIKDLDTLVYEEKQRGGKRTKEIMIEEALREFYEKNKQSSF
jgi:hypothetical protein